ncbi:SCO family protein [Paucibacter sp. R3-3]|uniref:SCO family protein n=1 Tax=Roseateles agri TaxID=3098619 RepID=A0ABU5DUF3_9BURK|nr:SCO family protein [Paucibacter sp. R3-3]MDY0749052.1 SCO family protein [Paucibacter sp. R3-3]
MTEAQSMRRGHAFWPTLALCMLILGGLSWAIARLTRGLEVWTYEDLRRLRAAEGLITAPALSLRDGQGRQWAMFDPAAASPRSSVYLVDFIYTSCPSVCTALGSEYTQMQEALRATSSSVRLLSISIDPVHDGTDELKAYGRLHRADASLWTIAAPVDPAAGQWLQERLGIVAIDDGLGGVLHNGAIQLIDRRGRLRRVFDYSQWPRALAAAQALAKKEPG